MTISASRQVRALLALMAASIVLGILEQGQTAAAAGTSDTLSCKAAEYARSNYKWFTSRLVRQRAQSANGDRSRLLAAMQRFADGGNLTIGVVGGSISAGQGAVDGDRYSTWMQKILQQELEEASSRLVVHNGAVPGTGSQYMSVCHNLHVLPNVDVVLVEYAINDEEMPMPHMDNVARRAYEKLLRKLLNYPRRPAVVLIHSFCWFRGPMGAFWASAERQQGEFALYYGLPQISVKAGVHHLMAKDEPGYQVRRPRADMGQEDPTHKGKAFYWDTVHPDGLTGHRIMGEMVAQLVLDAYALVVSGFRMHPDDMQSVQEPIPSPMLPGNMESSADRCFIAKTFQRSVISSVGWKWVDEGKDKSLPKCGYISSTPGTTLRMKVDTTASGIHSTNSTNEVTVEVGYLRSYENMGKASVVCESGCTCDPWVLDGHHEKHNSQTFLHEFRVTQSTECIIAVTVSSTTFSGKHKVKLTGMMISEDPNAGGFQNSAAWDDVSGRAATSDSGVFDT